LAEIQRHKDDWDLIRRRALRQIGWRKGQARSKRRLLARLTWEQWLDDFIHRWTREVADWCKSQGVGTIQIDGIDTGDWPAFMFRQRLDYKAKEHGIEVADKVVTEVPAAKRSVARVMEIDRKNVKRRSEALRELTDQMTKRKRNAAD